MVHRSHQDLQIQVQVICILFYSKYLFNMLGISAGIVSEIEKYVLIIVTLISVQKNFILLANIRVPTSESASVHPVIIFVILPQQLQSVTVRT